MLKLKKIAVTGGLSSGKTTVCQIFKKLGAYVINSDEIVHQLLSPRIPPGTVITQQLIDIFGPAILSDSHIDRQKLAAKAFSDPELLKVLENILHPVIFNEIEEKYKQAKKENSHPLFIVEVPLLFETRKESEFDAVIAVVSDKEICKKRFAEHKGYSSQEFELRNSRQLSSQQKAQKADYTLINNGNLEQLKQNVKDLYSKLSQPSA